MWRISSTAGRALSSNTLIATKTFGAHLPKPHPEIELASVIALNDFTAENGATRVAPGSHRWAPEKTAVFSDLVPAEMKAALR